MLQPLTGESSLVQSSILTQMPELISGCKDSGPKAVTQFFDTRVFYPHAASYRSRPLKSILRQWRMTKRNSMQIGQKSWTWLLYTSCFFLLWRRQEASVVLKKLADALATKRNENYSHVSGWLRCCLAGKVSYPLHTWISLNSSWASSPSTSWLGPGRGGGKEEERWTNWNLMFGFLELLEVSGTIKVDLVLE